MPQPGDLSSLVQRLDRRRTLSGADRAAIVALPRTIREVDAAAYVVREGQQATYSIVLLDGFAFRQKITAEGGRQILSIHIPGEPVDFQNLYLEVADHSVQTLTRARIAVLAQTDLRRLIVDRPSVGEAIMFESLVDGSIFREQIVNIGRRDARTRIAHLLCEFALRLEANGIPSENGYDLPMTQEHLADMLGLTPVHVNRTLKALQATGLITRSKRHVSVPDWKALREVGEFNARYLHLHDKPVT